MWHRTTQIKIKGQKVDVILYLDVNNEGEEQICFRAMMNEYFMTFEIVIGDDRDLAHSLIKNFPIETIQVKMESLAYANGAIGG